MEQNKNLKELAEILVTPHRFQTPVVKELARLAQIPSLPDNVFTQNELTDFPHGPQSA